jgi:hypothetical protein
MTETTYQDLHYDVVQTMIALEEGEIEHDKAIEQLTLACEHFLGVKEILEAFTDSRKYMDGEIVSERIGKKAREILATLEVSK